MNDQPDTDEDVVAAAQETTDAPEPAAETTDAPDPAPETTDAPEPAAETTDEPEPAAETTDAPEPAAEAADEPVVYAPPMAPNSPDDLTVQLSDGPIHFDVRNFVDRDTFSHLIKVEGGTFAGSIPFLVKCQGQITASGDGRVSFDGAKAKIGTHPITFSYLNDQGVTKDLVIEITVTEDLGED